MLKLGEAVARYLLLVLTNPVPGREEEFNDWYTNRHLGDVLKTPGFISAQRFAPTPVQVGDTPVPWTYFALYDIETDDLKKSIDELMSRAGTPKMPLSEAMQPNPPVYVLQAITARKTRDQMA